MSVKLTSGYWLIKSLQKKTKVIQGGQGASKTYSILILFFELAWSNKYTFTVVTETYPQLADGVIMDMKSIVESAGLSWDELYNKTEKNLRLNDSLIQFRNIDNKDFHKAKGSRREYLFINEGNRIAWTSIEQMITRTDKGIFIDYNPDREFWVHEQILKGDTKDVDFIILTYLHNECLSPGEREEIEKRRGNNEWWRIYGEGMLGIYSDRQVYKYNFIDNIPDTAKRIPSGMDFGVSPDPTTLIDMYIDGVNLYCDEVFTVNNLMPEKIPGAERQAIVDKMAEVNYEKGWLIVADSAGATEIRDLRKHGFNIFGVKKQPGSIIDGISMLRSYNIYITKRSTGIKKACESWFFKVDGDGRIIPEPEGHEPDQLAAMRYVVMMKNRLWS